jgi:hypothetical protein
MSGIGCGMIDPESLLALSNAGLLEAHFTFDGSMYRPSKTTV